MTDTTLHWRIPAIHCDGCLRTVRRTVEEAGGRWESGDARRKLVTIQFDPSRVTADSLEEALEAVGFPPEVPDV